MQARQTAEMQASPTVVLDRDSLHTSLGEPVLGAISFLNEVMDRYPGTISFAPGAPAPAFLEDLDVAACMKRYAEYVGHAEKLPPSRVRRRLYQYGPSRGLINGLLADALRKDRLLDVVAQAIVVTVGFQEAFLLTLRALFASPRDVLAVVQPCFVGALGAARVLGIETRGVHEVQGRVDLAGLSGLCMEVRQQGKRVRAVYVAPDHANPTGTILTRAAREELLRAADAEDLLLLEDGAYGFTSAPDAELPSLKSLDRAGRVIHFGTFAKICIPGVRVGFVVADQRIAPGRGRLLADELAAIKSMTTVNTSPLCQAVVGGMILEHGGSIASLGRSKGDFYRRNLAHLLAALDRELGSLRDAGCGVSWNTPSGGFFVRMRLPCRVDADLLERSAREHGVLWTPMRDFYVDDAGHHELRLSCSYLEPHEIDEGVQRLGMFVRAACASAEGVAVR